MSIMRINIRFLLPLIRPKLSYNVVRFSSYTHFGYESVREDEKQGKVNQVFENVASKYDFMNDAMSFGIHRFWKDCFVHEAMPSLDLQCLDVAGGTGDIAFRLVKYAHSRSSNAFKEVESTGQEPAKSDISVTVCDINAAMMEVGRKKAESLGLSSALTWTEGNAESLPFKDNSFDLYTIAFGIRNCTNVQQVLNEAHRVLKPYGRFMCLEFSRVDNPILRYVYDEYSFQMIPVLGQVIAGDWHSYQYLVESIRQFPEQREFVKMIEMAGFSAVRYKNYTNGIAAVHSGFKLPLRSKT